MKRVGFLFILVMLMSGVFPALAEEEASAAYAPVSGSAAVDVVKNFYTTLTAVMKQGEKLGFSGRYKKLEPAVNAAFNLPLMTKFVVGLGWGNATAEEQDQLIKAFSEFSIANYAGRFGKYDGEQFNVLGEKPTAGGKIVETTLKPKDGDAIALNYLMRQDEKGAWRILDVFTAGAISELATRRSEFSSVIQHDGLSALVNALGEKSKQMGPT